MKNQKITIDEEYILQDDEGRDTGPGANDNNDQDIIDCEQILETQEKQKPVFRKTGISTYRGNGTPEKFKKRFIIFREHVAEGNEVKKKKKKKSSYKRNSQMTES